MGSEIIINAIAKQPWIEAAADPLQKAIRAAFPGEEGRKVKNLLHGTWLGHPLHPILTDIPVGAWTVAMVLDALEGMSGNKQLRGGADVAIGLGLLGAVGAAVTGATDWSETDDRAKKVGLMHAVLNIVATGFYTTSWIMRKTKNRQSGIAFSMLGYAIANASAYLGGHLVFGEQIGVDHTATSDNKKPQDFTPVIAATELKDDTPTRVLAEGVAIVLVKRGSNIFALSDTCPHLGGPLSEGKLVGDAIQCPWHQSEMRLEDGSVVNGPTTYAARCFNVRINNGRVEVRAANKHAAQ